MVQMNWFAGQKLRHRFRGQTYGHQGGKEVPVADGELTAGAETLEKLQTLRVREVALRTTGREMLQRIQSSKERWILEIFWKNKRLMKNSGRLRNSQSV